MDTQHSFAVIFGVVDQRYAGQAYNYMNHVGNVGKAVFQQIGGTYSTQFALARFEPRAIRRHLDGAHGIIVVPYSRIHRGRRATVAKSLGGIFSSSDKGKQTP